MQNINQINSVETIIFVELKNKQKIKFGKHQAFHNGSRL